MIATKPNVYEDLQHCLESSDSVLEINRRFLGYTKLKQGWSTPKWERAGTWHVIYLMELGELRVIQDGQTWSVTPGQSVFVGAAARPAMRMSAPVEFREIWFSARSTSSAASLETCDLVQPGGVPSDAPGLLDRIAADLLTGRDVGELPLVLPRLRLFAALLAEDARSENQAGRALTANQRVRMMRWVREHLADPPTPRGLAAVLGLSPDYFARLFKQSFGQAPRDWLLAERVNSARRLLDETGASLAEAMESTGFRNHAHFARIMKRITGRTPSGHPGWKRGSRQG